ncbi:hypothetical protein VTO73DRAFT_7104 [Trametes versicolor]
MTDTTWPALQSWTKIIRIYTRGALGRSHGQSRSYIPPLFPTSPTPALHFQHGLHRIPTIDWHGSGLPLVLPTY